MSVLTWAIASGALAETAKHGKAQHAHHQPPARHNDNHQITQQATQTQDANPSAATTSTIPRVSFDLQHDAQNGTVDIHIRMSEAAVLIFYLSGCAFLIGGLSLGCAVWQRQHKVDKIDPCECKWCTGKLTERKRLGKGGFGEASLVVCAGRSLVLKRIGCNHVNAANQALLEASCLQRLQHPGVVRFEDVFMHRHENGGCEVLIVMEFCAGGDLIDRLECRRGELPLTEERILHFLSVLCRTLSFVHSCGILHRDLKSSNIFVTKNDATVKLGDFGLAATGLSRRRLNGSPRRHSRCGTNMYMSPEVEARRPYGAASDTYGAGCVLLELLLHSQLRERRAAETRREAISAALKLAQRRHGWKRFTEVASLAWQMLDESPRSRISLPTAAEMASQIGATLDEPPAKRFAPSRPPEPELAVASAASDAEAAVRKRRVGSHAGVPQRGRRHRYAD